MGMTVGSQIGLSTSDDIMGSLVMEYEFTFAYILYQLVSFTLDVCVRLAIDIYLELEYESKGYLSGRVARFLPSHLFHSLIEQLYPGENCW